MDPFESQSAGKQSYRRDSRDSLEIFNPSTKTTASTAPPLRPNPAWKNWGESQGTSDPVPDKNLSDSKHHLSKSSSSKTDEGTSWMALKNPTPPQLPLPPLIEKTISSATKTLPDSDQYRKNIENDVPLSRETGAAAQRAAEWGLVLKTDDETGKPQGVGVRNSGGDRPPSSRKNSTNSEDSDGGVGRGIPRVSEDLKDALSTFQQTFVVSDATKPDFPILYASAGFFKMTGYTSREVIGRNCRFMQGAGTDPQDVMKIREALEAGSSYCGRLMNYKKDGSPFWNLLTIAPIKDDEGKVLKFIGMQVEVSKHTEGAKEKTVRPNGLPESLIKYDARQQESATSSVTELVLAVKDPQALSESTNRQFRKSEGGGTGGSGRPRSSDNPPGRRNSENVAPHRRNSHGNMRNSMQRINEIPEKKPRKSGLRSFMKFKGKGHSNAEENENLGFALEDDDDSEDDVYNGGRPESMDDKIRKKEMRKGIDLATTLERIEKNFVITDPRLPDNPIIFASDSFLELTEYSREEILGRNCM